MSKIKKQNNYKNSNTGAIIGILEKTKSGNAFVRRTEGSDIFIASEDTSNAMNSDTVSVDLFPELFWGKNPSGRVDHVIKRGNPEISGRLQVRNRSKFGFVIPVYKNIGETVMVPKSSFNGAVNGDFVISKITEYPTTPDTLAKADITTIIAHGNNPAGEIKTLIRSAGFSENFEKKVEKEASMQSIKPVEPTKDRTDYRDHTVITIDRADSKDLDDAVSLDILDNGNYLLSVHIADVSWYVREGTALDHEAFNRSTSVYLLTKTLPMLPKNLSNGICSLFEGADRYTLTCSMEFDHEGRLVNHSIEKSIISSTARMVYDDVSDILETGDEELKEKYKNYNGHNVTELIFNMEELASILHKNRLAEGSIDFDLDEASITLDDTTLEPVEITLSQRRTANRIIEEFMLAANRTVAKHFNKPGIPFVYRIHEKPELKDIIQLKNFLLSQGLELKGQDDDIKPAAFSELIEKISGSDKETLILKSLLKTMTKAYYSPECLGHFGLGFSDYCHFTSPIRRYPDLIIHRIIHSIIENGKKDLQHFEKIVEPASERSSLMERKAMELERDVIKMKMAEYMENHIGSIFTGIISGITDYGIYVQLPNTIEGMVPLGSMHKDFFDYLPEKHCLKGRHSNTVYTLGDPVKIKVVRADPSQRQIDFELAPKKKKRKKRYKNNNKR